MILTADNLVSLGASYDNAEKYIEHLNIGFDEREYSDIQKCHFLAQVYTESGALSVIEENLNYRKPERLVQIFSKYIPNLTAAQKYVKNPEALGNLVYSNRLGNGPNEGYAYRGRSLIQLTGKSNYTKCGNDLGIDLIENPDLLFVPEITVQSSLWYFDVNNIASYATDTRIETVKRVSKAVNGGYNGLAERQEYFLKATEIIL